jgi:hypothetical protein
MKFSLFRLIPVWAVTLTVSLVLTTAWAAQAATAPVTVQIVGSGTVNPNLNGQRLTIGTKYSMTAKPKSGFSFAGWSGSLTSSKSKLTFTHTHGLTFTATFVDNQKPALKINTIPNKDALEIATFNIGGTAKDNDAVAKVYYRVNGAEWMEASTANGWSNWWGSVTLAAGNNVLEAYAKDASGNDSKITQTKLVYTVTPTSLANTFMTVTTPTHDVITLDFSTNTFTETTGIGSYTYSKKSPTVGQLTLNYTAPPSAAEDVGKIVLDLQFSRPNEGTFADSSGRSSFTLATAEDWASPTLGGSSLLFAYDDGTNSLLSILEPPLVVADGTTTLRNPLIVPLDSDYPGEIGDRVQVTFARWHYTSQNNTWYERPPEAFAGNIIEIGDEIVSVLFDTGPKNDKSNFYSLLDEAPLDILTCAYASYAGPVQVTNTTAIYAFTNTSPAGGLLKLDVAGQSQYLVLNYVNDASDGTFYEEDYTTSETHVRTGTFAIALPPQITTSPTNQTATNGGTASFWVKVSGTPPLAYQWQFNGTNLTNGTNLWGSIISGTATTNLTVGGIVTNDLGSYRCVVTNLFGRATSSAATLALQYPPEITSQPVTSLTVTNGDKASFSVTATGSTPLSYRWQYYGSNLVNSPAISGVTSNTLSFTPANTNHTGNYQVVITNTYGAVTSTISFLNVVTP